LDSKELKRLEIPILANHNGPTVGYILGIVYLITIFRIRER